MRVTMKERDDIWILGTYEADRGKKIGKKNSCLAGIQEIELKLRIKLRSILFLALLEDVLWKNS